KGIIDKTDYVIEEDNEYADLIDTLTKEDSSALELKFYPIIPNVVNTLTSEFSKRVTRVTYGAVDEYSYNEMLEQKKSEVEQLLVTDARQKMAERMIQMGADPQSEEFQQQMSTENLKTLPQIEAFYQKDYRSMIEQWAEHQHRVDTERYYMDELEERGFRDLLITDREFWHFKMLEDDYDVELWNPVLTFYQKSPETRYISDGNWVGKYDMMTVADVIDKYGWLMTEEQMTAIELIYPVRSAGYPISGYQNDGAYYDGTKSHEWNTNMPSLGYRQFTSMWDSAMYGGDIVNWIMMENEDYLDMGMSNLLRVTTVYWKSQRRVGHLTKITLSGETVTDIVDEDYVITDKPQYNTSIIKNKNKYTLVFGEHIDWIWINQTWGGVKIGPNRPTFWGTNNPGGITPIYLGINQNHIGPLKFQFKGDNSLYGCKLPVEGSVFSDRNTYSRSLVDLMKPFQIAYNIVNNQIADILVDELGTVIMLDQNSLPRHSLGEDWGKGNFAKAYVAMKNFQMLPLDTSITNTENALNFNHFQKLDMSQTERLMSRIQLAQYFKSQAFEVIGITPQRLGQEITRQTATGIEQSVNASYAQTETYFIQHCDYLMPRVHQMRTDLAQYYHSTKPSTRLNYITSLDERKNFEINATDFLLRDINVFATTKANQRAILEQLKQLAINNNTSGASIYDLGNILKSDSIAEVTHILKQTEKKADQIRQQEQQQQQQMQEQMLEAKQQEQQIKLQFESEEGEKDRQANILIAQIRSAGYGAMMDINKNEQSDYLDAMDQIQKTEQYQQTMALDSEKETNKMMQSREKIAVDREKINAQKEIAQTQLKIAQENKNRFDAPKKTEQKDKKKK
ncbi:MAG: hypothetical protein EBU90_23160, partial [Proteobacteria bacterium]|nr:hypothetical protein [Pseudomonadota bacterium]